MKRVYSLGIIGHPVGHTLSPVLHKTAAEHNGIELDYKPYDVSPDELRGFMEGLRGGGIDGLNVTVPLKVAVMDFMDELSAAARGIGAVNTIINKEGKLVGDNTDEYGFITSMAENAGEDMACKKVFLYGAGGAARAICGAIDNIGGVDLVIANRTESKAEKLAARLGNRGASVEAIGFDSDKLVDSIRSADIIINATSIGMKGNTEERLPGVEYISKGQLVVDIVYRPLETPLLKQAGARGARTLDGLWMLIHQGARSFKLWTGAGFPIDLAREKLLLELNNN